MLTNLDNNRQRGSAALQQELTRYRQLCQRKDRHRRENAVSHACAIVMVHGVTADTFGKMTITADAGPVAFSLTSAIGRTEG